MRFFSNCAFEKILFCFHFCRKYERALILDWYFFFERSHCFLCKICSLLYLYSTVTCWVYFLSMLYDFLFVICFKEHNCNVPWYIIYVSCVWSSVTFLDMLVYGFPSNWAIDQPLFLQIPLCFPLSSPVETYGPKLPVY